MILAYDGSRIDGSAYTAVVDLAHRTPGWLDGLISAWSAYGLALFAVLMVAGWWRARRCGPEAAVQALAAPVIVVLAYAVNDGLKQVVREDRPCQTLHRAVLEACPAPGDWSFPSNHAALAAAAAAALWFVSARLGAVATLAALAMGASRVWVGAHYPHDVAAGLVIGTAVALPLGAALHHRPHALARRLAATRLRPLLSEPGA
ncbi:phosphatase PAP2 family protein [Streptomyces sparsogenes]|uniref:Integral membrane protein n=1 Tax=Streptomyces sparsogenes DSM 40356 TaxID=1331668 RepID=A0A1R1SB94_9ACTN|nr:phosphatase PAP2 family protein [Streptomyces sparsogenes]OMI35448.1 integral membrane protein [Streptomyces sparsogenes DSM 40356]